jgi:hypothetical protein
MNGQEGWFALSLKKETDGIVVKQPIECSLQGLCYDYNPKTEYN